MKTKDSREHAEREAIRILVAGQCDNGREGLGSIVEGETDMTVAAAVSQCSELLREVEAIQPDVLVVEDTLPGADVLETVQKMTRLRSKLAVLVVSRHNDCRYVLRALHAGACGYLLKVHAGSELARAVRKVASLRTYIGPGIAGIVSSAETNAAAGSGVPRSDGMEAR